jgi:hypothetical protein
MKHVAIPIGVLSILLVLVLNLLAASSVLHERLHADAGKTDHECAVKLFAHGQVDSATVDLPVAIPPASIEPAPQIPSSVFAPAIENLPAARGPPAALLHS